MKVLLAAVTLILISVIALSGWRYLDQRRTNAVWQQLVATEKLNPSLFDPKSLAELPEVAQRFFKFSIKPGTLLNRVVEITMRGELGLGTKEAPAYMPMTACQLLAPPYGFVWQVSAGTGLTSLLGSDAAFPGGSWTRFWMARLLPVARIGDTRDHARSSFGRYMGEAIFWSPASLLPSESVVWKANGRNSARVTVTQHSLVQAFDIEIDEQGRPVLVRFERWSDANQNKVYRLQPFGGYLSEFKNFEGFMLPTRVLAGNHFGTDEYFPFFKVDVDKIHFVKQAGAKHCRA